MPSLPGTTERLMTFTVGLLTDIEQGVRQIEMNVDDLTFLDHLFEEARQELDDYYEDLMKPLS